MPPINNYLNFGQVDENLCLLILPKGKQQALNDFKKVDSFGEGNSVRFCLDHNLKQS